MSNNSQPQAYPPTSTAYPDEPQGAYIAPPTTVAYPVKDGQQDQIPPAETQSRGDGFWKGCCAGLCCYCLLDACF
ncbi:hypothetical protein CDL12_15252 [Handroanthus impetiginosus]|uniref:Cysteine-rich transmembrane domain-containing protein n=1 Tax=Handroanthus impetiginosus TaxID=429701 RepID=A0A2G9H3N8_9LAMI|nr:hypothetical protein CDL12_15252 [Handroanthus impetiginosus]